MGEIFTVIFFVYSVIHIFIFTCKSAITVGFVTTDHVSIIREWICHKCHKETLIVQGTGNKSQ